jgi:hypothetical protein
MIRTRYPAGGDVEKFPIFVYVFVTDEDEAGADVGYFFQNQLTALTDLNALMCGRLHPPHLGDAAIPGHFDGGDPIAQLAITTSLNSADRRTPLETQIRIVAESCFERIYAWSSGQMSAKAQQTITGQDILPAFPGEPLRRMERSYRFGAFGMRRWEMPRSKLEELVALDHLVYGLRQMIFNHWEDKQGYLDSLDSTGSIDLSEYASDLLSEIDEPRQPSPKLDTLIQRLDEELFQVTEGKIRDESPQSPSAIKRELDNYYKNTFEQSGVDAIIRRRGSGQAEGVTQAIRLIDARLTSLWLDSTHRIALARIPQLLEEFGRRLRTELQGTENNESEVTRRKKLLNSRGREWKKLTFLSALFRRKQLLYAHTKDCVAINKFDLRDRFAELDKNFIRSLLNELSELANRYRTVQQRLKEILTQAEHERGLIKRELQDLHSDTAANKYEFDVDALDEFSRWSGCHQDHQRNAADLLRKEIQDYCGRNKPISSLIGTQGTDLADTLLRKAKAQAALIHQEYRDEGLGQPILEEALMDRLQKRYSQDTTAFRNEIKDYLEQAATCLQYKQGAVQPAELLGTGMNVPHMPKRLWMLGLPQHTFAPTLRQEFERTFFAGTGRVLDVYTHNDPTQIRLMLMDYWLALRFTSVADALAKHYQRTTNSTQGGLTRYFCNIDADGEGGDRPMLFLPDDNQMRLRYEAELWLGEQKELGVVVIDDNGVHLMHRDDDGLHPELLAKNLETAMDTADRAKMDRLHTQLSEALDSSDRSEISQLFKTRREEIRQSHGETSKEYKRWDQMLTQLKTLVN